MISLLNQSLKHYRHKAVFHSALSNNNHEEAAQRIAQLDPAKDNRLILIILENFLPQTRVIINGRVQEIRGASSSGTTLPNQEILSKSQIEKVAQEFIKLRQRREGIENRQLGGEELIGHLRVSPYLESESPVPSDEDFFANYSPEMQIQIRQKAARIQAKKYLAERAKEKN